RRSPSAPGRGSRGRSASATGRPARLPARGAAARWDRPASRRRALSFPVCANFRSVAAVLHRAPATRAVLRAIPEHGTTGGARALLESGPGAVELGEERDGQDPADGSADPDRLGPDGLRAEIDAEPGLASGAVEHPDRPGVRRSTHVLVHPRSEGLEDPGGPAEIRLVSRLVHREQVVFAEPPLHRVEAGRQRVSRSLEVIVQGQEAANELEIAGCRRETEERASHPAKRSRRRGNRALRKARRAVAWGAERNPDERPLMDSLDDWILFGPRMH